MSEREAEDFPRRQARPCPAEREWLPPFTLDLYGVLSPLRRGRGDPTWRAVADGATIWRVSTTPQGPATLAIRRRADGTVRATGWGPGAAWEIDGLLSLLGADDDPSVFTAHHPVVADAAGKHRALPEPPLPFLVDQPGQDLAGRRRTGRRGAVLLARRAACVRGPAQWD